MESNFFSHQMRWLMDRSKAKVAEKSQQIGLTWAEAYGCMEKRCFASPAGMKCIYCGHNKESAIELMMKCAEWARTLSIAFGNIEVGVVIDEVVFHEDLPEMLKLRTLTMLGCSVSIISTHNGVDNDFNKLCENKKLRNKPFSWHRIMFADEQAEKLVTRLSEPVFEAVDFNDKGYGDHVPPMEQWGGSKYCNVT